MAEKMVEEKVMEEFIYGMKRGFQCVFLECKIVAEAYAYKRAIPKNYWKSSQTCEGIMNINPPLKKAEVRTIREEMIEAICEALADENLEADNYMRLLHGLTLLGVHKSSLKVPATRRNMSYNLAYRLWGVDDGTDHVWECIDSAAWYAAELHKRDGYTMDHLITGFRFK